MRSSMLLLPTLALVCALSACGQTSDRHSVVGHGPDAHTQEAPEPPAPAETTAAAPPPPEAPPVASVETNGGSATSETVWDRGTVTLLVSTNGPEVAQIVFEDNRLVRIDFTTKNAATKAKVQKVVDDAVAEAKRGTLTVKYHRYERGERTGRNIARPKPGEPQFARALYHWIVDHDLNARAK